MDALRIGIDQPDQTGGHPYEAAVGLGYRALAGAEPDAIISDAITLVKSALGADLVEVHELLPDSRRLIFRAGLGWGEALRSASEIDADGDSHAAYTLRIGESVAIPDLGQETRFQPTAVLREHGAVSGICVPIPAEGWIGGVLGVYAIQKRSFTAQEIATLRAAGNAIGAALQRGRRESQRYGTEEMELLFTVAGLLAQDIDFNEKATQVLGELARHFRAWEVTLRVPDENQKGMRRVATAGPFAALGPAPLLVPFGAGIGEIAYRTGEPVVANNYASHPKAVSSIVERGSKSGLALPIRSGGKTIGVVIMAAEEPDWFPVSRVRLLTTIVDELAPLLENAQLQEVARLHAEEMETLISVTRLLVQPGTFQERVKRVLEELARVSHAAVVILGLRDERLRALRPVAAVGPQAEAIREGHHLPYGEGIAGAAFLRAEPIVSNDLVNDPTATGPFVSQGLRSMISVPIRVNNEALGVVTVGSMEPGHFTDRLVRVLVAVTDGIGALLDTARLEEEERLRSEEAELLSTIAHLLVEEGSFEAKVNRVLEEIGKASIADSVVLRSVDENAGGLRLVAIQGRNPTVAETRTVLPFSEGLGGAAFRTGEPAVSNNYRDEPRAIPRIVQEGVRSGLALPVRTSNRTIAVVIVSSREENHFTERRVRLLTAVTNGLGALLENARLYDELTEELDQGRRRLSAFQAASTRLAIEADPDRALRSLLGDARGLFGAPYCALALWGARGKPRRWTATILSREGAAEVERTIEAAGLLAMVQKKPRTVRVGRDIFAGVAPKGSATGPTAFLGTPVLSRGNQVGVCYVVYTAEGAAFTESDERLLSLFAGLASVLADNVRLFQESNQERASLAAVQASMTEGLIVLDENRRIRYLNQAVAREGIVGEQPGRNFDEVLNEARILLEPLDVLEPVREAVRNLQDQPKAVEISLEKPRKDLRITVFPIDVTNEGRLTGLLVHDTTQERDLDRQRNALISVASHELRTPLMSIMGFAELLLRKDPPHPTRGEWLEYIHRGSSRLAAIVDDLLNVSRIQTGRMVLQEADVPLGSAIEDALKDIQPMTEKHTFVTRLSRGLPTAVADRTKLVEVLVNLLSNAVKYSPTGGEITIFARHQRSRQRIVVAVQDHGIGIAPEDQERVFSTFYRIRRPETEGVTGTGLGLYVVRGLVELMGGEIWLESEVNKGSTFYFSLPAGGSSAGQALGGHRTKGSVSRARKK